MKLNEYYTQGGDFAKKTTFVITPIYRVITKLHQGPGKLLRAGLEKESFPEKQQELPYFKGVWRGLYFVNPTGKSPPWVSAAKGRSGGKAPGHPVHRS